MKKKLIGIIIFMLLVGTVFPATGTFIQINKPSLPSINGNTLYVGGNGPGNYTKIEDAIENASDGDTIFVYSGQYDLKDFLDIYKSIKLIGENKINTIINKFVTMINVSNVEISGFTFQGGNGILIFPIPDEELNNITISGNIFKNEDVYNTWIGGILVGNSTNINIFDNAFYKCGLILYSYHNSVYNNIVNGKPLVYLKENSDKVIDDAGQVILINCKNITIKNLELSDIIFGIQLINTVDCLISDNDFSNNPWLGLILNSSNNIISGNIFSRNDIGLIVLDSEGNEISKNYFENNIFSLFFGMSSDNQISYNNIKYNLGFNHNIISVESDNKWIGNFWNRPRLLPVIIWDFKFGRFRLIPFRLNSIDIDWRPALKPNDLTVGYTHYNIQEKNIFRNKIESYSIILNLLGQFPKFQKLLDLIK